MNKPCTKHSFDFFDSLDEKCAVCGYSPRLVIEYLQNEVYHQKAASSQLTSGRQDSIEEVLLSARND